MKDEPNNKKHLTPRQIINRYRKGVYVDESIEVISSVISSCGQTFDSIAVAFPTTLAEKVLDNLTTAQLLYERQAAGQPINDIAIDDYPRLKTYDWIFLVVFGCFEIQCCPKRFIGTMNMRLL